MIKRLGLGLEKRNNVRKNMRKLRLSGVITVDPFEILEGGKNIYGNLYKLRRIYSDESELFFRFEDLLIPTLSHESRSPGEGLISLEGSALKNYKLYL